MARLNELHDFGTLDGPLNAIYLTPVSGIENKMGDKGEYREWALFILHNVDLQTFPLRWIAGLGPEDECVFFMVIATGTKKAPENCRIRQFPIYECRIGKLN